MLTYGYADDNASCKDERSPPPELGSAFVTVKTNAGLYLDDSTSYPQFLLHLKS
jgi:hypothetical protein